MTYRLTPCLPRTTNGSRRHVTSCEQRCVTTGRCRTSRPNNCRFRTIRRSSTKCNPGLCRDQSPACTRPFGSIFCEVFEQLHGYSKYQILQQCFGTVKYFDVCWWNSADFYRLKEFAKLYDIIKNERNKCVNQIQTSTQKAAEMREKIKILQNEIEILRTAVYQKDRYPHTWVNRDHLVCPSCVWVHGWLQF